VPLHWQKGRGGEPVRHLGGKPLGQFLQKKRKHAANVANTMGDTPWEGREHLRGLGGEVIRGEQAIWKGWVGRMLRVQRRGVGLGVS